LKERGSVRIAARAAPPRTWPFWVRFSPGVWASPGALAALLAVTVVLRGGGPDREQPSAVAVITMTRRMADVAPRRLICPVESWPSGQKIGH